MPDLIWIGYLVVSFISLGTHISALLRRVEPARPQGFKGWPPSLRAALGALLLLVPLFFLLYVGMLPRWGYGPAYIAFNLLLPLLWAHLAVHSWGAGQGFWERYAIGASFLLTLPAIFLSAWLGILARSPWIQVLDWGLLLTGVAAWLKLRHGQP